MGFSDITRYLSPFLFGLDPTSLAAFGGMPAASGRPGWGGAPTPADPPRLPVAPVQALPFIAPEPCHPPPHLPPWVMSVAPGGARPSNGGSIGSWQSGALGSQPILPLLQMGDATDSLGQVPPLPWLRI
jgi:hypothetical protein